MTPPMVTAHGRPAMETPSIAELAVPTPPPRKEDEEWAARRARSRGRRSPSGLPLRTGFRSFSGVATILVGDAADKMRPETKYLVHKELLTSASPFFAAALNSTFAEGMDQTVRLPEEKPEIFEWFLQWLYTGTLKTPTERMHFATHGVLHTPVPHGAAASTPPALAELHETDVRTDGELRNTQGSPKYFLLLDLYSLSDRLLTTPLSNHVLSTIARLSETTNSVPTPSDTWILYDDGGVRDSAPLRRLVLDLFHYKKTDRLLETHRDEWHPRFLRELCVQLKRPGPESVERHRTHLAPFRPASWAASRACEVCREVLPPGLGGEKCMACDKTFCAGCMRGNGKGCTATSAAGPWPTDVSGCKPWGGRGMCVRYHEHGEGEVCG